MRNKPIDRGLIIVSLILIIIVATVGVLSSQLRSDDITTVVENQSMIDALLVIDAAGDLLLIEALIYHPATGKSALVNVPPNTGAIIQRLGRVDRIDTLYGMGEIDDFRTEVETLIGTPLPFYLVIDGEGLSDLVDLLEGVEVFIASNYGPAEGGPALMLPAGNVVLDGAKVQDYLSFEEPGETDVERVERRQAFVRRLLAAIGSKAEYLSHRQVTPYFVGAIESNMDRRSLLTFAESLAALDVNRSISRRVQGNERVVEIAGNRDTLLFPHFEGQWLRETVRQVRDSLATDESFRDENVVISLEILNGTAINGLARRTRELYESFGFDVVSFSNAESTGIEHTVVVDRRGNVELAQRAAEIIRATRVVSDLAPDSSADVTIILGRDFDGTYVRQ
jgi:polyisoprenyl-teichoic acid--peptidoglycan teichoic acid transferase